MKMLFAWTGVTSYMADCWRRLRSADGVELKIVVENVHSGRAFDAGRVLAGLDCAVVDGGAEWSPDPGWRPDVLFAVGWRSRMVRGLVRRADWRGVPKVCCFDMPWRWRPRCIAARWVLHPFIRNYSAAYVPGRLCARYARWLGFPRVETGLFSIDAARLKSSVGEGRRDGFLFIGRYSPEKRVDLVEAAHRRYRELGGSWGLDCYGQGGRFVQPDEMPRVYASHACLLLASAFDPWPLVALEARTAGCEVIMSDRCGNRFELPGVRVVPYGDVEAMAREMLAAERSSAGAAADAADALARYDCAAWAVRTTNLASALASGRGAA